MKQHHIKDSAKNYFEGWYFKHQKGDDFLALIPGVSFTPEGEAGAFIQVVAGEETWFIPYRYDRFSASDDFLEVRVGNSVFSETGIALDIDTPELKCRGSIEYGPLLPLKGDIMGPFALVPGLQCRHGVISLYHSLKGKVEINGKTLDFTGGRGYLEKDWGKSFPQRYTWFHCSDFRGEEPVSVMAAVADVPLGPATVRGVIATVYVDGREHRIATYNGGRVLACDEEQIALKRGGDTLTIQVKPGWGKPLQAPAMGEMSRIIRERPSCTCTVTFAQGDKVVLSETSRHASYESDWMAQ